MKTFRKMAAPTPGDGKYLPVGSRNSKPKNMVKVKQGIRFIILSSLEGFVTGECQQIFLRKAYSRLVTEFVSFQTMIITLHFL